MKVHHLNCATLRPPSARLIHGQGGWWERGRLPCHCLLLELPQGLALVDTGIGLASIARPEAVRKALKFVRPQLDPEQSAARQIEGLGAQPADVRHIALTHLDTDHAGGLADFPLATVHVLATEHEAATHPSSLAERQRYVPSLWKQARWQLHSVQGEQWMSFDCVRSLAPGLDDAVLLVPLTGHTRGHCGIAVRSPRGWLLHCGDAYMASTQLDSAPRCPAGLRLMQRLAAGDNRLRLANLHRLREFQRQHAAEVELLCSHDAGELERAREPRTLSPILVTPRAARG